MDVKDIAGPEMIAKAVTLARSGSDEVEKRLAFADPEQLRQGVIEALEELVSVYQSLLLRARSGEAREVVREMYGLLVAGLNRSVQ